MPSLYFFTISAQLSVRVLATRLFTRADLRTCDSTADLRTCDPNAGKTLREQGEPLTAISSFNSALLTSTQSLFEFLFPISSKVQLAGDKGS